ncbi:hypothetical protein [Knoellia sinensis]|nr:hypothetical protein [Knoellia sinensis]
MIEREMRRGARAYRDVFGMSAPNSSGAALDFFLRKLADAPQPLHTNQSGLELVDVAGPPLAMRLSPTSDTAAVLTHALASVVGYTMAGFGRSFGIRWFAGTNVRSSDQDLRSVVDFVQTNRPAFHVASLREHSAEDLNSTVFQFVSSPTPKKHLGFEVHLVVQRVWRDRVDLVHAWY